MLHSFISEKSYIITLINQLYYSIKCSNAKLFNNNTAIKESMINVYSLLNTQAIE